MTDNPIEEQPPFDVRPHQIRQFFAALPSIVPLLFVMPAVVAVVFSGTTATWLVALWLAGAYAVVAARIWIARSYRKKGSLDLPSALRCVHRFTCTSFLSGLTWGLGAFPFFAPDSIGRQVFYLVCLVGLAAGSIIVSSYWLSTYYWFAIPSLGLAAVAVARQGGAHVGLAAMLVGFIFVIARVARIQAAAAHELLRLRVANLDLARRAEKANRAKSMFLAAASHDLRQPLQSLKLFSAALAQQLAGPTQLELLSRMDRSSDALGALLDSLLDISQLDAGVVRVDVRDFWLNDLLTELSLEYGPRVESKGLAWNCLSPPLPVRSDRVLLETILRNLLGNALQHTDVGHVILEGAAAGGWVSVAVVDTGRGIPLEHRDDIFREFFQLHNDARDRRKGLGLGLAIVRRLARLLEHPLTLESRSGHGTTFRLQLPLGSATQASALEDVVVEVDAPQSGVVAIIEDDADILDAMTTLLGRWGYRAIGGLSYLDEVADVPCALLCDYRLGDRATGIEAIDELRRRYGPEVPALIFTGEIEGAALRRLVTEEITVLGKPLSPAKLRAFLCRAASKATAIPTSQRHASLASDSRR